MPRLPRSALPPYGTFHIWTRGVNRCAIFHDVYDYRLFTVVFRREMRKADLKVHVYCCMPNHYHAVVEGPMEAISRALHRINTIHAMAYNERHDRSGHLFQARFKARVVQDDDDLAGVCDYVLNNPVRAGLCAHASDWPWSGRLLPPPPA